MKADKLILAQLLTKFNLFFMTNLDKYKINRYFFTSLKRTNALCIDSSVI